MANDGKWWEPSPIWSNGLPWYMIFSHNHISSLTLAPALKTARASSKAPRRENAWPRVFPKPLHQKVYPLFFILRTQHPSSERFCDFHVRVKKECPFSHKSTHKKPLCCLLNFVGQIRQYNTNGPPKKLSQFSHVYWENHWFWCPPWTPWLNQKGEHPAAQPQSRGRRLPLRGFHPKPQLSRLWTCKIVQHGHAKLYVFICF